jgi:hypothetical protein
MRTVAPSDDDDFSSGPPESDPDDPGHMLDLDRSR